MSRLSGSPGSRPSLAPGRRSQGSRGARRRSACRGWSGPGCGSSRSTRTSGSSSSTCGELLLPRAGVGHDVRDVALAWHASFHRPGGADRVGSARSAARRSSRSADRPSRRWRRPRRRGAHPGKGVGEDVWPLRVSTSASQRLAMAARAEPWPALPGLPGPARASASPAGTPPRWGAASCRSSSVCMLSSPTMGALLGARSAGSRSTARSGSRP